MGQSLSDIEFVFYKSRKQKSSETLGKDTFSTSTTSDWLIPHLSISSGQRNLMKTYHNDANTSGITKIALKIFLDFF